MKYKILSLVDADVWDSLLKRLPINQQDIYYAPEYYHLYENYGDGKTQCFIFEKDDEIALYPFLLNSVNNLGYELDNEYYDIQGAYGYNGVVSSSNGEGFINEFYRIFQEYCKENSVIAEFTRFHPLIKNKNFSHRYFELVFDRSTIYVDLKKNINEIFKGFNRTTRKIIRRITNRYNISSEVYQNSRDALDILYSIYSDTMDRVGSIKYLYFNREYFKNLLDLKNSHCIIAYKDNKPISGIIMLRYGIYMHGHLGGTLTSSLKFSPFNYLYAEIIKYAKDVGCHFLHLGGGTTKSPEDPVLRYKMHFSNTLTDYYIGKKIHDRNIYNEIVTQWSDAYPEKVDQYKNILLKYRY
jgi:hypothetical protein